MAQKDDPLFQEAEESLRQKQKKFPAGIVLTVLGLALIAGTLAICFKMGLFG